jgi:hypothetical protein
LSRKKNSAVVPPNRTPAASSSVTPSGHRDQAASVRHELLGVRPQAQAGHAAHPVADGDALDLRSHRLDQAREGAPSTARRGRRTPKISRAGTPKPAGKRAPRIRESAEVTAADVTRTSASRDPASAWHLRHAHHVRTAVPVEHCCAHRPHPLQS